MIGLPGVVTVPGLPGVFGGTEYRVPVPEYRVPVPGPSVTGACSEYTGRSTGNC